MKRTPPTVLTAVLSSLLFLLVASIFLLPGRVRAASNDKAVTVDYVIALLDQGVEPAKIIDRIEQKGLTFRLAPGDMARLRAAGAKGELVDAVVDHVAVPEGQGQGQGQAPAPGTDGWGRPSRLGNAPGAGSGQEQSPSPDTGDEQSYEQQQGSGDGQGIEEQPYADSYGYAYPGYYSGYYDFYYGYPYPYYYPYPYGAYFYYSYPYYHSYYYPRHYVYGGFGRGGGRTWRGSPRGGHFSPGGGGGSHSGGRPAPRGSHH